MRLKLPRRSTVAAPAGPVGAAGKTGSPRSSRSSRSTRSGLRRLRRIRPQHAILQRSAVESSNDRAHLLRIRRVDKREALGLLRFGVANHFNRVRDQAFGCQPAPDIVRSHPGGQIAQKYGKTHSEIVFDSIRWGLLREIIREATSMLAQAAKRVNSNLGGGVHRLKSSKNQAMVSKAAAGLRGLPTAVFSNSSAGSIPLNRFTSSPCSLGDSTRATGRVA